jgi:hypothetical protein
MIAGLEVACHGPLLGAVFDIIIVYPDARDDDWDVS